MIASETTSLGLLLDKGGWPLRVEDRLRRIMSNLGDYRNRPEFCQALIQIHSVSKQWKYYKYVDYDVPDEIVISFADKNESDATCTTDENRTHNVLTASLFL